MHKVSILFVFFVCIASSLTAKENPVTLDPFEHRKNISSELLFMEDPESNLTPLQVYRFSQWKKVQGESLQFNFSKKAFWLKFRIRFREGNRENLYFVLKSKAHDKAELFIPNGVLPVQEVGDKVSRSKWSVKNILYPAFQLEGDPGEEKVYYVRLKSESIMSFPTELMDEAGIRGNLALETGFISLSAFLYGSLIFFALLYYRATGYKEFLFYSGYAFCMGASYDVNYGNAIGFILDDGLLCSERSNFFFFQLGGVFGFEFIRRFLETRKDLLWLDRILFLASAALLLSLPLVFLLETISYVTRLNEFIYAFTIPLILGSGIYLRRKGNKKLNLFLLSWGIYMTLGYISIFYYIGLVDYNFWIVYSVPLFLPLDLIILLYNIILKYSRNLEEKNNLIESLNEFLNKPRYSRSKISGLDVEESLSALEYLMNRDKLFQDEEVSMNLVASRVGLTNHQLSELLNSRLGMGFAAYINSKRIEEAKRLLRTGEEENILNIAFNVGFGSKTSFNVEFKKLTGLTPKQYKSLSEKEIG